MRSCAWLAVAAAAIRVPEDRPTDAPLNWGLTDEYTTAEPQSLLQGGKVEEAKLQEKVVNGGHGQEHAFHVTEGGGESAADKRRLNFDKPAPKAAKPPGYLMENNHEKVFVIDAIWIKPEDKVAVFLTANHYKPRPDYSFAEFGDVMNLGPKIKTVPSAVLPGVRLHRNGRFDDLACSPVREQLNDEHMTRLITILSCDLAGKASDKEDLKIVVGREGKEVIVSAGIAGTSSFAAGPFRSNTRAPAVAASEKLRISVCSTHLSGPKAKMLLPFAEDILAYYKLADVSHVYWTIHSRETHQRLSELLQSYVEEGFLSLILFRLPGLPLATSDDMDLADIGFNQSAFGVGSGEQDGWAFKAIQNNLCLYHAKNYDDLMLIADFDELLTTSDARTLPEAMAANLQLNGLPGATAADQARSVCYITACPRVMFPSALEKIRLADESDSYYPTTATLAKAYPTMDGGVEGGGDLQENQVAHLQCGRKYAEIYRKSLAVVKNTMYVGLHEHGSCLLPGMQDGVRPRTPVAAGERYAPGAYLFLERDDGIHLGHYAQMFQLGRFEPDALIVADAQGGPSFSDIHRNLDVILARLKLPTHEKAPSLFKEAWAERVSEQRKAVGAARLGEGLQSVVKSSPERRLPNGSPSRVHIR